MDLFSNLPPYYKPHRPHSNRRAKFHNYKCPGSYLITISKSPDAPIFSTLHGDPLSGLHSCITKLIAIGEILDYHISHLNDNEKFEIKHYVIMPDHIHILWKVKYWLEKDLGWYIGLLKAACSNSWRRMSNGLPEQSSPPTTPTAWQTTPRFHRITESSLFLPNFNDKISFSDDMTGRFINYIYDNPRRRLLMMRDPAIFQRRYKVRILDQEFDIFGNFNLLKHPVIAPVIVSSRYTDAEREEHDRNYKEAIRSGGVLISPFISQAEKEIMRLAISEGASIIRIIPDGIPPRYKPSGHEFELCSEGRCLHIGIPREAGGSLEWHRGDALHLNNLARWIARHPAETLALINAASSFRR